MRRTAGGAARCRSCVTTAPARALRSRSQATFGAAKYGSSSSPLISASRSAQPSARSRRAHRRRSAVLPHDAGRQGTAGRPVPRQHRLALVGQADRVDRPAGIATTACRPAPTTLSQSSSGSSSTDPSRAVRHRDRPLHDRPGRCRRPRPPPPWSPRSPDRSRGSSRLRSCRAQPSTIDGSGRCRARGWRAAIASVAPAGRLDDPRGRAPDSVCRRCGR